MLASFESLDGGGKSLQAARLAEVLKARYGEDKVYLLRQPGNSSIGKIVRELIFDPKLNRSAASILIQADRIADVHENIIPALADGKIVICDRYLDSTTAYQGYGEGWDIDLCHRLSYDVCSGVVPNRTYLLDIPVDVSIARSRKDSDFYTDDSRIEKLARIAEGYRELAAADPNRWRIIDATQSIDKVFEEIMADINFLFGWNSN